MPGHAPLSVVDLAPVARPPEGAGSPVVVLVHGTLDRAESFRRVARRLPGLRVVSYDRRGYQRARHRQIAEGLADHAADLLAVVQSLHDPRGVVAVGHSLGGDVVIAAALAEPDRFSAIGAYEPPMPWVEPPPPRPRPDPDPAGDGDDAVVARFFNSVVGDDAWERLSERARAMRRPDGPALAADLRALGAGAPFDAAALRVPAVFGRGGASSAAHHRRTVAWLAEHVPGATLYEIGAAGHGAHLSHPDAFAGFVRAVCDRATAGAGAGSGGGAPARPAAEGPAR